MSAAEHLAEAIDVGCSRDDHDHVGDHRAEVLDEAARIALSLRQFEKVTGARWSAQVSENVGILRVAEALAAAGKGTGATGGEPTPADFYQAGQTYQDLDGTTFRCDVVTTDPEDGEPSALGWGRFKGEWFPDSCGPEDWAMYQEGLKLRTASGGGQ